ncbi:glycosyltransferase [bacterium]|nr:glycosyltransferase [bacterium]
MTFRFAQERTQTDKIESETYLSFSQIKPVHNLHDKNIQDCINTFSQQDYKGRQELIVAVDGKDSLPNDWSEVAQQFGVEPRLSSCAVEGENRKIAVCIPAAELAKGDVLLISDSDMCASKQFLQRLNVALSEEEVGLATCLYTVKNMHTCGAVFEGLFINDFCASVLVARLVEGIHFALGAVMAVKREVLEEIGGLKAIKDYLADDYQLGFRTSQIGRKVVLATEVVEDTVDKLTFSQFFSHQLRWMRTSRLSRPGGFFSFFITQGTFWSLGACLLSGLSLWSLYLLNIWLILRIFTAGYIWSTLAEKQSLMKYAFLAPLKDLLYIVLWAMALFGDKVEWGGVYYKFKSDGTMIRC